MSRDALINAAIDSLVKKILPQLQEELSELRKQNEIDSQIELSQETTALIKECRELLSMISPDIAHPSGNHVQKNLQAIDELSDDLSDEEAQALMAAMDDQSVTAPTPGSKQISANDSEDQLEDIEGDDEELSDEEAQRLLAEMDGSHNSGDHANEELSDEEAQRLLAEMENPSSKAVSKSTPPPSDDDDAEALLAKLGGSEEASEEATSTAEVGSIAVEEIDEWEANDFQTDPDMVNDFITNADEIMENLDETILKLEQDPQNKSIIEEIFRGAHTLKGAAGMFGFRALERVMHRLENLFDLIRKEKLVANADVVDVVFEGLDMLRTLLGAVKDGQPCGAKTAPIVNALEHVAQGKKSPLKRPSSQSKGQEPHIAEATPEPSPASNVVNAAPKPETGSQSTGKEKDTKKKEQSTIRVDLERLDVLVNLVGELVIDRTRFASIEEELRTNHPQIEVTGNISETVQLFSRHMNEIQDIIMKVRMVPIGNAFNKFTRIVRDLARSLEKKIDLVISGENAELDKTLVEQIGDPLIHLIRNSCDHGIEDPATRTANGKSPNGTIFLSAHQEGNHIVIKIEDDGKGIPADVIRRKGIERGLISEDEQLTDRDIFNLIFEPGFSTAEKVTNISGRGVGMDVVKKQIMKLKGMIEIDSEFGRGTTITIRLPLTLAIVQSLLVRSSDEVFAIPLASVIESIRVSPSELQKVGETEVFKLRDKVLPLIHLNEALGLQRKHNSIADMLRQKRQKNLIKSRRSQERLFIVVVGHAERPTGIIVDQLLNQQEMVIKSMGPLMRNIPCVAGGAVLGHGEVVLVLDVPELEEATKGRTRMLAS